MPPNCIAASLQLFRQDSQEQLATLHRLGKAPASRRRNDRKRKEGGMVRADHPGDRREAGTLALSGLDDPTKVMGYPGGTEKR